MAFHNIFAAVALLFCKKNKKALISKHTGVLKLINELIQSMNFF